MSASLSLVLRRLALSLAACASAASAQVVVEGARYDGTIVLGGQPLVLNGVGVRKRFVFDIYVGGLLIGLVQFYPFADVSVGPAAPAFAGVVVLTMLASRVFDPRLLWDAAVPGRRRFVHG